MNDRELLELAAKAAGAEYEVDADDYGIWLHSAIGGQSGAWDPLTDDGDALRLAVKLGLWITIDDEQEMTADAIKAVSGSNGERPKHFTERFKYPQYGDRYVATRRAIVRAAAEIGRAMK